MIKFMHSQYTTFNCEDNKKNMFSIWLQMGSRVIWQKHFELKP